MPRTQISQPWILSSTPGTLDLENQQLERLIADVQQASGPSTPSKPSSNTRPEPSPTKSKQVTTSGSSSSLSPASQLPSPTVGPLKASDNRKMREDSMSSDDSHQPPPAASIPQYQTFGSDPLAFDDPTTYHIREVTANMTDEEKKEIFGVSSFPHDDLSELIAGVPPDKDFSNAKPSNQVNANTFATYLEPYLRPLTEEDMAFLKERVSSVLKYVLELQGLINVGRPSDSVPHAPSRPETLH